MKEEFVTYEQALALKELGFDVLINAIWLTNANSELQLGFGSWINSNKSPDHLSAPLKQQVFRWFREKHNLWFRPDYYDEMREYDYQGSIHQLGRYSSLASLDNCKTVEELEAKCIDKLIEIVKNK
jgi:hypothetical protein